MSRVRVVPAHEFAGPSVVCLTCGELEAEVRMHPPKVNLDPYTADFALLSGLMLGGAWRVGWIPDMAYMAVYVNPEAHQVTCSTATWETLCASRDAMNGFVVIAKCSPAGMLTLSGAVFDAAQAKQAKKMPLRRSANEIDELLDTATALIRSASSGAPRAYLLDKHAQAQEQLVRLQRELNNVAIAMELARDAIVFGD